MKLQYLPNLLTAMRLALSLPIVIAIVYQEPLVAIALFFLAALSDGLDGFLARRYGWETRVGSMLDPLADKVLLVSAFLSLSFIDLIPFWLTLLVAGRDCLIMVGAMVYRSVVGRLDFQPSRLGKLCTLFQLTLVLTAMISMALEVSEPVVFLQPVVVLFTLGSGLHYVADWSRKGWRHFH
ncbi:MAG: CDP-alcohol phosphatidyltransferase family protein [Endozoicomonas sp.]